jgi:hypothetical protein
LSSNSGQAIIEYILVLVVTVGLVLGGLYQLNTAFKKWAEAYFGDYLACLLETGELPTIGGNPGDSGICNEFFKPFTLSDGRPLLQKGQQHPSRPNNRGAGGARERQRTGPGGGAGNYIPIASFPRNGAGQFGANGQKGRGAGGDAIYTGNTSAGGYGGGYTNRANSNSEKDKSRLDNSFAFEDQSQKQKRRDLSSTRSAPPEGGSYASRRPMPKDIKKAPPPDADVGMSFGNFMRFLIIAAIIIALVVFLGGQLLQVSKSME